MTMASTTVSSGIRARLGRDGKKLLKNFALIVAVSPLIGWTISRAWVPGNQLYAVIGSVLGAALGVGTFKALEVVASGVFGAYLGFLLVFTYDVRKRIQGVLLLLGTVLGVVVLTIQGRFLVNIDPGFRPNQIVFALSLASALFVESDRLAALDADESMGDGPPFDPGRIRRLTALIRNPRLGDGTVPEFTTAARGLFWLLTSLIGLSLVQVAIAGVFHPADLLAVVGVYFLYQFIQYEVKSDFMLIGPRQSGKTMTMLGMVLEVLRSNADVSPEPNDYLQDGIERANTPLLGKPWPFPGNDGTHKARFQMLVGDLFPRRMRLLSWDFPGQLLSALPDAVERRAEADSPWLPFGGPDTGESFAQADGGEAGAVPSSGGDRSTLDILADAVYEADILMIVIDCRRFALPSDRIDPNDTDLNGELGVNHYKRILQTADVDETIVVATKADILFHEGYGDVDPPEEMGGYEAFARRVNDQLSDRDEIKTLLSATGSGEIVPVYFETEYDEESEEYVPDRDPDSGNMPIKGFDYLLERVREVA